MANLKNQLNEYAKALGPILDEAPKAVLAAIAVSALTQGGDRLPDAKKRLADEWLILFENGVVPQKPGRHASASLSKAEGR